MQVPGNYAVTTFHGYCRYKNRNSPRPMAFMGLRRTSLKRHAHPNHKDVSCT